MILVLLLVATGFWLTLGSQIITSACFYYYTAVVLQMIAYRAGRLALASEQAYYRVAHEYSRESPGI